MKIVTGKQNNFGKQIIFLDRRVSVDSNGVMEVDEDFGKKILDVYPDLYEQGKEPKNEDVNEAVKESPITEVTEEVETADLDVWTEENLNKLSQAEIIDLAVENDLGKEEALKKLPSKKTLVTFVLNKVKSLN